MNQVYLHYYIYQLKKNQPKSKNKASQIKLGLDFWDFMQLPKMERCDVIKSPSKKAPWHTHLRRKKEVVEKELSFKNRLHQLNARGLN